MKVKHLAPPKDYIKLCNLRVEWQKYLRSVNADISNTQNGLGLISLLEKAYMLGKDSNSHENIYNVDERAILDLLGGGQIYIDNITIVVKKSSARKQMIKAINTIRQIMRIREIEISDPMPKYFPK